MVLSFQEVKSLPAGRACSGFHAVQAGPDHRYAGDMLRAGIT